MSSVPPAILTNPACPVCGTEGSVVGGLCAGCLAATAFGFDEPEPTSVEPSDARPERLGNYELLEEIGRGGMGVVYRARQLGMEREVALKVIASGPLADPDFVSRFRSEARLAGKLHHPNIVAIHEVGEADGHAYFSMDLVHGGTLSRQVRDHGPMSPRAAAILAAKLTKALEHAHAASVLHRDLKPANILLDQEGEPKMADFGLARSVNDVSLTLSAQSLGTPAWLAPEQITDVKNPTAATDVYGIGTLLYFMLTGRAPFPGHSVSELLDQVQHSDPVSPRLLDAAVPRDLETITLRCLEKSPARRFQTAAELTAELERFLAGEPILSRPVSPLHRLWRWAQRRKALAAALVTLAVVLLGSTVSLTLLYWRARESAASEKTQRQIATAELWNSLVQTAHGQRLTGSPTARSQALESISRAAKIKVDESLRNEAVAALVLPEIREGNEIYSRKDRGWGLDFHPSRKYAVCEDPENPGRLMTLLLRSDSEPRRLSLQTGGKTLAFGYTTAGKWIYRAHLYGVDFWNSGSGQPLVLPHPHPIQGICLAVSTSKDDLLAACQQQSPEQNFIKLLELPKGNVRGTIRTGGPGVMLLSSQGKWLALALQTPPASQIQTSGSMLQIFQCTKAPFELVKEVQFSQLITSFAWDSDDTRLLCGTDSGRILIVEPTSCQEIMRCAGHEMRVTQMKFLADDRYFMTTSWDRTARLWDATLGELVLTIPRMGNFSVMGDEKSLLIQHAYSQVIEYSLDLPKQLRLLAPPPVSDALRNESVKPAFSYDDRTVFVAGKNQSLAWDVASGNLVATGPASLSLLPMPNGDLLSATSGGLMEMSFHGAFGPQNLMGLARGCNHAMLSADGNVAIVTANAPGNGGPCSMIEVWRAREFQRSWISGMSFPPVAANADGSLVASGGHQNCKLRIWNTADGTPLPLQGPAAAEWEDGMSVAMNEAGTCVASISGRQIRLWELPAGRLRWEIPRAGAAATSAAVFSPDGKLLATTGIGHEIWLINPQDGSRLATLDYQRSTQPFNLCFSHDGTKLAANLNVRAVLIWDLASLRGSLEYLGLNW